MFGAGKEIWVLVTSSLPTPLKERFACIVYGHFCTKAIETAIKLPTSNASPGERGYFFLHGMQLGIWCGFLPAFSIAFGELELEMG